MLNIVIWKENGRVGILSQKHYHEGPYSLLHLFQDVHCLEQILCVQTVVSLQRVKTCPRHVIQATEGSGTKIFYYFIEINLN